MIVVELLEKPAKFGEDITEVYVQEIKIGSITRYTEYDTNFMAQDCWGNNIGGYYKTDREALLDILVEHHLIAFKP